MLLRKLGSESGTAVFEFLIFAVLLILPLTSFATSTALAMVQKSQLQSSADLMARAFVVAGEEGFERQKEHSQKPGWVVSVENLNSGVAVTVCDGTSCAEARSVG